MWVDFLQQRHSGTFLIILLDFFGGKCGFRPLQLQDPFKKTGYVRIFSFSYMFVFFACISSVTHQNWPWFSLTPSKCLPQNPHFEWKLAQKMVKFKILPRNHGNTVATYSNQGNIIHNQLFPYSNSFEMRYNITPFYNNMLVINWV